MSDEVTETYSAKVVFLDIELDLITTLLDNFEDL